jgi:TolB-like protein/class 3 adenylate cyclase/cytochrome c-type biogenesis protein CcmH/NrfG
MESSETKRKLTAILSADVVGYSRLMGEDDASTLRALKQSREIIKTLIGPHGGRVVDTAGDSVLAEFESVVEAVECAVRIQRALKEQNADLPKERRMEFRIGINLGDVIFDQEQIYGDGVNVAARIQALAEPGGIYISGIVYNQVNNKLDLGYEFVGKQKVKNITEPVPVYRLTTGPIHPAAAILRRLRPGIATTWIVIIVAVLGGATYAWWTGWSRPGHIPGVTHEAMAPVLVVLPFANLSNDPDQEYFSDGITGDITTDLSRLGSLRVIARQSAFYYKGQAVKLKEVGRDLGVRYVIEGSVQKEGQHLRINVQLSDVKKGYQLWAERFDRTTGDLFAVQDEIAHRLVEAMSVTLSEEEHRRLAHRYTSNVEAYDLFLRGQEAYVRQNPTENVRAQELFQKAIALDPNFARAYGALALTQTDDWRLGWSENAEHGADEALRLARRAVELDNELPQAYWALGFVHIFRGEHVDAIRAAERAIALDPNNTDAYVTLAISTAYAGDPERSIALMRMAMEMNPHYGARYPSVLGLSYYQAGKYLEAVAILLDAITRNTQRIPPRLYLTAAYLNIEQKAEAEWQVAEVLTIKPDFTLDKLERLVPYGDPEKLEAFRTLLQQAGLN